MIISAELFFNSEITAIVGRRFESFGAVCVNLKTKRIVLLLPGELVRECPQLPVHEMSSSMSNEMSLVVLTRADSMAVTRAFVISLEHMHVPPIMKVNSSVLDCTDGEILGLGDTDGLGETEASNTPMNIKNSPVLC